MNPPTPADRARRAWTWAWIGLALALALHVVDEATHDFLGFWNPLVQSIRRRIPLLPLPTFSFGVWLTGLILGVLLMLWLTRYVHRGARAMRPLSYALGVMMVGNGVFHTVASLYEGRLIPGVYSSPFLAAAGIALVVTARRDRHRAVPP